MGGVATPGMEKVVPDDLASRIDACMKGAHVDEARRDVRSFVQWITAVEKDPHVNELLSADCWNRRGSIVIVLRQEDFKEHSESNRRVRITPNDDGTNRVELSKQVLRSPSTPAQWNWVGTPLNELISRYTLNEVKAGFNRELTKKVEDLEKASQPPGRRGR
jgi:hypothetical protein